MCVIVDANCAKDVLHPSPQVEFAPIMKAILDGKARLVLGGSKQKTEYQRIYSAWRYIKILDQAGKARLVSDDDVDAEQEQIQNHLTIQSDDAHILALARISGARLLCSRDQPLHQDFGDPDIIDNPRGSIYQVASHTHLIRKCCGRGNR